MTSRDRPLRGVILVLDALLVVAAIALAAGLQATLRDHFGVLKAPPAFREYAAIVYLSVPLWIALTVVFGLHRMFERVWTRAALLWDLVKLHLAGMVGLAVAVFFTQSTINRSLVALFLGASFLLSYFVRSALAGWLRYQHATGLGRTRLLLVCEDTPALHQFLADAAASVRPPVVVGYLGRGEAGTLERLGGVEDIARVLHDEVVDRVVFLPPFHRTSELHDAVAACETVGVAAEVAIDVSSPSRLPPRVVDLYGRPYISFDPVPKPPERLALKHAFDWVAAALGLIVLSPLLVVVSLAVLVTMGRPVFFLQARAGRYGRPFRMIKFRTMVPDAEAKRAALQTHNEMSGPVFKLSRDPRVTKLGHLLRRTSIDELPQLVNVLLGQMSLVGPRPLPIQEQQAIRGWHRRRLSMRPGITGIWQVSGRSNIDFEDWMRLDQRYVDDWSLALDFKILLKTVAVVLLRRGAR
jgi:exopolysaccharide biosynthesis polyprenyl glycosylphosphotransferase